MQFSSTINLISSFFIIKSTGYLLESNLCRLLEFLFRLLRALTLVSRCRRRLLRVEAGEDKDDEREESCGEDNTSCRLEVLEEDDEDNESVEFELDEEQSQLLDELDELVDEAAVVPLVVFRYKLV